MTVLGGPHARCYPEDAGRYFDYVLGFTDRTVIREVLSDGAPHRPAGRRLAALRQPTALPGLRERWKFVASTLRKAPTLKLVPMLGSFGCPYTCSFCIDSAVPYQPLDLDGLKEDLRFLAQQVRRPRVGWHDPNFGVRFDDTLDAIEEAAPPGSIDFIAETALSLLSEPHVKRWINVVRAVSSEGFGRIRHYYGGAAAGHRPAAPELLRAGDGEASGLLRRKDPPGSGPAVGVAPRRGPVPRSQRLPQVGGDGSRTSARGLE